MKLNKLFSGIIVASMLMFTSCDLAPEVYSDVPKDDYYKTPDQFATLLANAYSQLGGEYGYIYREGYWSMQEYTTDEVVVPTRGQDWYDNGVPQAMHLQTWEENTRDINNGWSFAYGGVAKCNAVLDKIVELQGSDESVYTDAAKAGVAETKVLRAWYHLLAMDLYGRIAIDDNSPEIKKNGVRQAESRKAVFEWIEKEIQDNIGKLANVRRYGSITRPVAHMILAKMYLNAEVYTGTPMWDKCIAHCDSIINGGYGYLLNADYFTTFKKDNTDNAEIIFPIVFDQVYANGNMFHLITLHYVHKQVYNFDTDCWNGPCTLGSFYDKYADNDKRKNQWFVGPIMKDGDTLTYKVPAMDDKELPAIIVDTVTTIEDGTAANTFEGPRFVKFEIEPGIKHHANSDFPIYRYADLLLMKAECLMRQNGGTATSEALALINQVHTRAGLPAYTSIDLDELLDERGRELAWEAHRRQDLIRFNKFTTGMWEFMSARSSNRNIFPIPTWVLDANPGVYTQNSWQ